MTIESLAHGRVNPIKSLAEQLIRPEVMILVDTSGSMRGDEDGTAVGAECTANNTDVDLANDGFCSGGEVFGSNDCNIASNSTATAGSAPKCQASTSKISRMMSAKRALWQVLPELRIVASVGLATFRQEGYFRYYQGTAGTTRKTSVYLSEWELRRFGGWNTVTTAPLASFSWNGTTMTLLSGAGLGETRDSLYRRQAGTASFEKRFAFSAAGNTYNDGTYEWKYIGSYYTFDQMPILTGTTSIQTTYMGPQFVSGATTWVYHRFNNDVSTGVNQYIDGTNYADGRVLVPFTSSTLQTDHDLQLGAILSRLNYAANGGIHGSGNTPTRQAIAAMRTHFVARTDGTAPYSSPDAQSSCRTRYLVVITDGVADSSPLTEVVNLYNQYPSNPIKTIAIGIPGSNMTELDAMADLGDDGVANTSATGYYAGTEAALVNVLRTVLFSALKGDYATAASTSVTSTDQSQVANNVAIQPSTEYPSWRGRLRAIDFSKACASDADCTALVPGTTCAANGYCLLWEAGAKLDTRIAAGAADPRYVYSGKRGVNANLPCRAWNASGQVCWGTTQALPGADGIYGTADDTTGGLPAGCTAGCGISSVWPGATANTADAAKQAVIAWLATQPLGPIINAVPATVGPPPAYGISDHDTTLGTDRAQRDTLIYTPSNNGILHAFRAADGREAFGYIPAAAWPKIATLKAQNGQDPDPTKATWILANSPRVEDVRVDVSSSEKWRTEMVVTMGLGGEDFSVIDISNPGDCTGGPPCTLALNTASGPFKMVADSSSTTHASYMGLTMSLPALYWKSDFSPQASFGSGYPGTSPDNEYHSQFTNLKSGGDASWAATAELFAYGLTNNAPTSPPPAFGTLSLASTASNYGVIAGAVAAIRNGSGEDMNILATYQAYLNGMILRFDEGKCKNASDRKLVLNAGTAHPFHLAPAVLYRGGSKVTLAAASGYYREEDPWMKSPSFTSQMFLRTESAGTVDNTNDNVSVAVNAVCNPSGTYTIATGACPDGAPGSGALPADRPILIDNEANGKVEAFFLYYEPATTASCGSVGTSWLIRIATAGANQELIKAQKLTGVEAAGISLIGGGKDIAIATSARGTSAALPQKRDSATPLGGGMLSGTPRVEVWREVR